MGYKKKIGWITRMYVYLVECNGLYKIGVATNVQNRIADLQVANAHEIKLVKKWLVLDAKRVEAN